MSKRQERRANRDFKGSRPNRRANERLSSAIAGYNAACAANKSNAQAYTKPGSKKAW